MKIDFEIKKDNWIFRDAISLPDDHQYTDADIEAMKQARFDRWYEMVTNPPVSQEEQQAAQE